MIYGIGVKISKTSKKKQVRILHRKFLSATNARIISINIRGYLLGLTRIGFPLTGRDPENHQVFTNVYLNCTVIPTGTFLADGYGSISGVPIYF
ncbi:MAG: hypothetical protein ACOCVN_00040 [bacterium]